MQTFSNTFIYELEILIKEEIERLRDALENSAVEGIDRTDHFRGRIAALRGMADLIDEASKRADRR